MALHKIIELCAEWFSVCLNITSKFLILYVFKSFIKQNYDSDTTLGMSMSLYCIKLNLLKCNGS
jgi:hypothetical protein